ncbi:MAG: M23 family metallopeptidase [Treponema sp.]|nr:M23 family metallopeptidase [Treponema sp.]
MIPKFNIFLRIGLLSLLVLCISILFLPEKASAVKQEEQSMNGAGGASVSALIQTDDSQSIGQDMASEAEPEALSKPKMLLYTSYTVKKDETVSGIAQRFALDTGTLISVNNIKEAKGLQIGQTLSIPNQDGIIYQGKRGEMLTAIAEKYKTERISVAEIQSVNEIFPNANKVMENTNLFIPRAKMDSTDLREISGDLFLWPVYGRASDSYGWRGNPFGSGGREFHNGMDIAAPTGTPIRAAMAGRVAFVGSDASYGNHVIITHSNGYRTLYAHMSVIRTTWGAYVGAGDRIGDVGSTGRSTGPHCHFTVYKNGVTINPRLLLR